MKTNNQIFGGWDSEYLIIVGKVILHAVNELSLNSND